MIGVSLDVDLGARVYVCLFICTCLSVCMHWHDWTAATMRWKFLLNAPLLICPHRRCFVMTINRVSSNREKESTFIYDKLIWQNKKLSCRDVKFS